MQSVIEVTEKTVNNTPVISFQKQWRDEEHEVFTPREHATQVLLQLLAVVNKDKADADKFVLARKGQVGDSAAEPVDSELLNIQAVKAVAGELLGEDAAASVEAALANGGDGK